MHSQLFPRSRSLFSLLPLLALASLAQTASAQSTSPVAYVYVATASHIQGFTAASNGRLTPVSGSPYSGSVSHLSVNSQYLFGPGDDNENVYSYTIGTGGTLTPATTTPILDKSDDCNATFGPTQIDFSGKFLYTLILGCDGPYTNVYKINHAATLGYEGGWYTQIPNPTTAPVPLRFLGNNQYGYITGCSSDTPEYVPATEVFGRNSQYGQLIPDGYYNGAPEPSDPWNFYCPSLLATDPTNHLAFAYQEFEPDLAEVAGPFYLASYTADAEGNLTTENNYSDMPVTSVGAVKAMSISPTGLFLAVGGNSGLQLFHFNGAAPITQMTGVLDSDQFTEVGWDKDNHLYALSPGALRVYTVTPSGVSEDPGSPYFITNASSVIVLSLN
jgi:hypothetical protein